MEFLAEYEFETVYKLEIRSFTADFFSQYSKWKDAPEKKNNLTGTLS